MILALSVGEKTAGHPDDPPWRTVGEGAADFALELDRAMPEPRAEFAAERAQALVSDIEADLCYCPFRSQQFFRALHAVTGEKAVRRFAEGQSEKAMEVIFRQAGFSCSLGEQDAGTVFRRQKIAGAAEAPEGVIWQQAVHGEMILAPALYTVSGAQ